MPVTRAAAASAGRRRDGSGREGPSCWGRVLGVSVCFTVKRLIRGRCSQNVNNGAEDTASASARGRRSDSSVTLRPKRVNKNLPYVLLRVPRPAFELGGSRLTS